MAFLPQAVASQWVQFVSMPSFQCVSVALNGRRSSMEDSHVMRCDDDSSFFGIFDGHAGRTCADFVAQQLPARCTALPTEADMAQWRDAALAVDDAFLAECPGDQSGCTGAFALLHSTSGRHAMRLGHVGDARIVVGSGAALRFATVDHSPSNPDEAARIAQAGGLVLGGRVNGTLAVARAFGDRSFKAPLPVVTALPDVAELSCQEDDFVLLACDGLFEPLALRSSEAVAQRIAKGLHAGSTVDAVLTSLCSEALRLGSLDNITALLVHFRTGGTPASWQRYVPGRLYPDLPDHRRTYCTFAHETAGLSPAQAAEARYDHLRALPSGPDRSVPLCLADILDHAEEHSPHVVQQELSWFGDGPPPHLSGSERTHWFAALLQEWEAAEGSPASCSSLMSSLVEAQEGEDKGDSCHEPGPDLSPVDLSDIFHCGNDSDFDVDPEMVHALAGLASPPAHSPSVELSLSTIASQRPRRLSCASSSARAGVSSINLSSILPSSSTPAKRRRLLNVHVAGHDTDSVVLHDSPAIRDAAVVQHLLLCWVEGLEKRRGLPVRWLHQVVLQLLWGGPFEAASEASTIPPSSLSPSSLFGTSTLFGSPRN